LSSAGYGSTVSSVNHISTWAFWAWAAACLAAVAVGLTENAYVGFGMVLALGVVGWLLER
jgi:hypothetical protein